MVSAPQQKHQFQAFSGFFQDKPKKQPYKIKVNTYSSNCLAICLMASSLLAIT